MEKLHWTHALVFLGSICVCLCAKDPNFCKDPTPPPGLPTRARPNVTNMFHTWVECVIINKNFTTDIHEYFDADHNRGFITQLYSGLRYDALYSYDSNEFITWYQNLNGGGVPGTCSVQDLSKTGQRFLLGYNKVNGAPHIFSANDALHLSGRNVNEVYMGVTSIRGILVDWWRSCQYWTSMDATMLVDWYFSAKPTWGSAVNVPIPVTAHVTGVTNNFTQAQRHFEHYYNFFHFKPFPDEVHSKKFETPAGLQCPGRKLTKKLPKLPDDAFSFTTEVLDLNRNKTTFLKETFFYSEKLVKYEHRSANGKAYLIEVHDFHAGLAYITDRQRGNCSVRPIADTDFDVRAAGANDVRIRNAKEFFYFDSSNLTYEGVKSNRKIKCDTWLGRRRDYPFQDPQNSTWEWYFAAKPWTEVAPGPEIGAIPIQMRIKVPGLGYNFQYNIYNFKKDKPDLLKFDISGCYELRNRTKFQIVLPRSYTSLIQQNVDLAKTAVLEAIVMNTGIKPIRVAHMQFYFEYDIRVTFEILDVSPIMGDTQRSKDYHEVPLDVATSSLSSIIQKGQFVVTLHGSAFQQPTSIVVSPMVQVGYSIAGSSGYNSTLYLVTSLYINTTAPPVKKTSGFGAGPMAAVGVTMPIVGLGIGMAGAYFFFR